MSRPPETTSHVAAFFDREAEPWDGAHGPDSVRAAEFAARADYLRVLCTELGRPAVVDFGCGTGRQLIDLAPAVARGIGLDLSPNMIARARRNAAQSGVSDTLEFLVGDTAAVDAESLGQFDLALFVGSLEHAPDQTAQLSAAAGLLQPRGRLVVFMPHPRNPGVAWARRFGPALDVPLRHLSPRGLRALAAAAGLRLESVRGLPYRASGPVAASALRRWPLLAGAYAARFALA